MISFKSLAHFFQNAFTFYVGGSPSPGPTTTTVQNSNLPDYVQPYVEGMLGSAQQQIYNTDASGNISGFKPYVPYSNDPTNYFAGASPLQQQSYNSASNLQTPDQFNQASQMSGASGMGAFNLANQANQYGGASAGVGMGGLGLGNQAAGYGATGAQAGQQATGYGAMGAGYGAQAGQAGQNYANQATNGSIGAYMNPYLSQSLDPQLAEIRRQYGITGTQEQGQATQAGAMGGSREALMASENQRNMGTAQNQAIAQGYNNAFTQAQQAQQYGANLGLQGAQAGIQGAQAGIAGQNAAMQGAGLGIQGAQAGMQGINTALSGLGQGITGVNAGLAGMGQANAAAGTLGQLGTQQLAAQQGVLNTQNTMGAQQQALEQGKINQAISNYATAQQYPMTQLGNMSNLLHGLPMQSTTTQSYQAAPSTINTLAGLGTGIAGAASLLKAEGGIIKGYAEGGAVKGFSSGGINSLMHRENLADTYESAGQVKTSMANKVIPDYIGIPLLQDKLNMQAEAQGAQSAQQANPNQPSIKDEVLARAQGVGIDSAPSNIQALAGGGIIAFDGTDGSVVQDPTSVTKTTTKSRSSKTPIDWASLYKPTDIDMAPVEAEIAGAMNPATGKAWTMDEVSAKNDAERKSRGIEDIYPKMLEQSTTDRATAEENKQQAKGLALLSASGKMLSSTSPFAGVGIGAGLGEFANQYGTASKEYSTAIKDINKQDNAIKLASQGIKEAQLAGDQAKLAQYTTALTTAQQNKQALLREQTKEANAGNLKGAEVQAKYLTDMDMERIKASVTKQTDLKDSTRLYYNAMVANGAPQNENTMAAARSKAYEMTGLAAGKLNLATQVAGTGEAKDVTSAQAKDPTILGAQHQIDLETMSRRPNQAKIASQQEIIDNRKKEIQSQFGSAPAPVAPAPTQAPVANPAAAGVQSKIVKTPQGNMVFTTPEEAKAFATRMKLTYP